jgi:hypothetical protein
VTEAGATPKKWQPVVLIADHRIECGQCSALAVIVILDNEHEGIPDALHTGQSDWGYTAWCQACWAKAQEEQTE